MDWTGTAMTGLERTGLDLDPSASICKHLQASGDIWGMWGHPEVSGNIRKHLEASEGIWKHLGSIWRHLEVRSRET